MVKVCTDFRGAFFDYHEITCNARSVNVKERRENGWWMGCFACTLRYLIQNENG